VIPGYLKNKPAVVINEVLPRDKNGDINSFYPSDLYCKAGHTASEGSRFFMVSGNIDRKLWGLYCENCIKAMNIIRKFKRERGLLSGDMNGD